MKIKIQIDKNCTEPKVIIMTEQITDEINAVMKRLSTDTSDMIAGFSEDQVTILDPSDILRFYSESGKIFAQTATTTYHIRLRLYELENRFSKTFVRISNSEIINLKMVKEFDLSFTGTICVTLVNGLVTYVSRRYVSKIKQVLGI